MNGSTITLPKKVFDDLVKATEHFERAKDELEDYMLSQNKNFIAQARKARYEHKKGKFLDLGKIRLRYDI